MKYNLPLEIKICKLLGIEPELCGNYSPYEQCCNDYRYSEGPDGSYCEAYCGYGANGYKFLPFSRLVLNIERFFNWLYWCKIKKEVSFKFKWL